MAEPRFEPADCIDPQEDTARILNAVNQLGIPMTLVATLCEVDTDKLERWRKGRTHPNVRSTRSLRALSALDYMLGRINSGETDIPNNPVDQKFSIAHGLIRELKAKNDPRLRVKPDAIILSPIAEIDAFDVSDRILEI